MKRNSIPIPLAIYLIVLFTGSIYSAPRGSDSVLLDTRATGGTFDATPSSWTDDGALWFKVEQTTTGKARSWTHEIRQAGDYQVGIAWIQVESGDNVALEIFRNGDERVKAVHAPAGEVTRFESRIEGLGADDSLTVKVTPDGGRYRMGYEVAITTSNFEGLPVFDVHDPDFGAVGNGTTDDFQAIRAAVEAAKAAGGGIVRFDGTRTYRAIGQDNLTVETLIDLEGAANIKVEGNGAHILLHPPDAFARIENAENIQVDGFTISYDPIPYYQGDITDINLDNMTIDILVPDRYPAPRVGVVENFATTAGGQGPFFGRAFIPDGPDARSGWGPANIYVESTSTIGGNPRHIRIQVPDMIGSAPMFPRVEVAYQNNATEFVVPHFDYGHRNGNTRIIRSSRVTLSNLYYSTMGHFWQSIISNHGPVTLSNVNLSVKDPETELLASWRDGMHIKNGRWGILVEEADWDGAAMYDDLFAIFSRRQVVVSASDSENVVTLRPSFQDPEAFLWQRGDWASFWTPNQGALRGMGRVISARNVGPGTFEVTFESIPSGVTPNDIVLHEESLNRGTLVRNNRTSSVGTKAGTTRLRGTDMRFENNHFEEFFFHLEWNDSLGTPRARDVVVENTFIGGRHNDMWLSRPLGVVFKNSELNNMRVIANSGAEDVYFDGVQWTDMSEDILTLRSDSSAWLFGASRRNGNIRDLADFVDADGGSSVTFAAPPDYPEEQPPVSQASTPPDAPALEGSATGGGVFLDWSEVPEAAAYGVYRSSNPNGPFLRQVRTQISDYVDREITAGQTYHYVVTSTDKDGNESAFSNPISVQVEGTILTPEADAYVRGGDGANQNFGSSSELQVKTDPAQERFTRKSYLRFDLSSLSEAPASVLLRLKLDSSTGSGDIHTAHAVADDTWSESGITWNNRPATGDALASGVVPEPGAWIEFDVTAQVASDLTGNQMFSTVLISKGPDLVRYHSRESNNPEDRPVLVMTGAADSGPAVPEGVSAAKTQGGDVALSWDPVAANSVTGYGIYRATSPDGPYEQMNITLSTGYRDDDVDPQQNYYYRVIAIDELGNASDFSDEFTAGELLVLSAYESWAVIRGLPQNTSAPDIDADRSGTKNLGEFAFNGDPLDAADNGLFFTEVKVADGGVTELRFTLAVRRGAVFDADGAKQVSAEIDGVGYKVEAGMALGKWNTVVNDLGSSDLPPAGSALPDLDGTDWEYRTFSASDETSNRVFIRAKVTM